MTTAHDGVRTVVHLLRHGEVHNPDHVLYGRLPGFHLSDHGRQQARAVAGDLHRRVPVAAVWASPLERAQETAAPLAEAFGLPVRTDERLIESDNVFEGRSLAWQWSYAGPRYWRHYRDPRTPSWGEPYRDVAARMIAGIDDARRAHPAGHVVCVSHQNPIWVTRRALEGLPLHHNPRRRRCAHASLTSLVYEGEHFVGTEYREPAEGP